MNTCKKCGSAVDESALVCANCGEQLSVSAIETREEKHTKPSKEPIKPMSVFGYLWTIFLLNVPLLGFVLSIVWTCGASKNANRRNLACAWLVLSIVYTLVGIVWMVANFSAVMSFLEAFAA